MKKNFRVGQKCSNKQTSKKLPVQSNYFHINENDIQLILQDKLTIGKTYLIELEITQILQEFGARTKSALFGGRENSKQFFGSSKEIAKKSTP